MFSFLSNTEFLTQLFGTDDMASVLTGLILALLGAILSVLLKATPEAIAANPISPAKFSWTYLIKDNWEKCLSAIIVTLVCLRFASLFVEPKYTAAASFLIGYLNYRLRPMLISALTNLMPFFKANTTDEKK